MTLFRELDEARRLRTDPSGGEREQTELLWRKGRSPSSRAMPPGPEVLGVLRSLDMPADCDRRSRGPQRKTVSTWTIKSSMSGATWDVSMSGGLWDRKESQRSGVRRQKHVGPEPQRSVVAALPLADPRPFLAVVSASPEDATRSVRAEQPSWPSFSSRPPRSLPAVVTAGRAGKAALPKLTRS
ncbi:hypothetical protein HJG60_008447 [Phyllostomus discolor]|uniref:Uncharacterized protein n=1 Tax=Phyllostomus discolor TaxID=89673 RepID=A0A833Z531_9CHIR|nr:hypothetical protein HJG60_008447 [Phyllostomus discolor]